MYFPMILDSTQTRAHTHTHTHTQAHTSVWAWGASLFTFPLSECLCSAALCCFPVIKERRKSLLSTCSRCLLSFCVYYLAPIGRTSRMLRHTRAHTQKSFTRAPGASLRLLPGSAFRFQLCRACLVGFALQRKIELSAARAGMFMLHTTEEVCLITHTHTHTHTHVQTCLLYDQWAHIDWAWLVSGGHFWTKCSLMNNQSPLMTHFFPPRINRVAVANNITCVLWRAESLQEDSPEFYRRANSYNTMW